MTKRERPTHSSLKENLAHSFQCVDIHGQHSNFLAFDLIEVVNIVMKKNGMETTSYIFEEMKQDILVHIFELISNPFKRSSGKTFREEFEDHEIRNLFSYFVSVAKFRMWHLVREDKRYNTFKESLLDDREFFSDRGELLGDCDETRYSEPPKRRTVQSRFHSCGESVAASEGYDEVSF